MTRPEYTLTDYVNWIGNIPFEDRPFSDADALVLCDVIYFEIFNDVDAIGRTLQDLIGRAPVEKAEIVKRLGGGMKEHVTFIRAVAASRRFGAMILSDYEEKFDEEKSIQFSAGTFRYKNILNFIAYRGTDDSIPGWKEDFMIAFTETAAQQMALEFANKNTAAGVENYIGGHSKGGNMALFAAATLPEEQFNLITQVYDLDGPGFCEEVFDLSLLDHIQSKTTRIVPEYSVIGKLFEPKINHTLIVASSETTVMQHELLSWGVKGDGLWTIPENDPQSENLNHMLAKWMNGISQEERKVFVNELFDALEAGGAKTMSDITEKGLDGLDKILFRMLGSSSETKKTAAALSEQAIFGDTLKEVRRQSFWKVLSKNGAMQALLLIFGGVFFIFGSENILNVISMMFFAGLTALQIVLTVKRFYESGWKIDAVRERIYLCVILLVMTLCILFKERAMFLFGSFLFSTLALVIAVQSGIKAGKHDKPKRWRLLYGAEAVLTIIFGISFLIIPESTVFAYAISIGTGLIFDGIIRLFYECYDAIHKKRQA